MSPIIDSIATASDWAQEASLRLAQGLREAHQKNGRAAFAGCGGSTPAPIYRHLAQADIDWSRTLVTLVDERYVPATSPDSNARLVGETLLAGPASAARFVPLYHPAVTVDRAAALAAAALRSEGARLDAVLLGMGEDGHIASMFPHSPTLKTLLAPAAKPTVLGVPQGRDGLAPSMERLSLNLAYLVEAQTLVLAITGTAKRAVLEREARGDPATQPIAALIAARAATGRSLDVLWTETL